MGAMLEDSEGTVAKVVAKAVKAVVVEKVVAGVPAVAMVAREVVKVALAGEVGQAVAVAVVTE